MDYDKQRKSYEAQTMVFSKALLNGGRNFVKYNIKTKKYATGNTANNQTIVEHSRKARR